MTDKALAVRTESSVKDYISLLKPGVMSLVVYTGFIGLFIAPGNIHPVIGLIAIICIAFGSGAAGAINMWYDRDIDAIMQRTKSRPIPAGRIDADSVLHFGVAISFASVLVMGLFVNVLSALVLAFAIFFYVVIYTILLKRRTPQNIVIGGAAGAFPPVIGWAAVTNNISIEPILMFAIIFLWTPPHFWSLALAKRGDYHKANVPMMPNVKGDEYTKSQIFIYSVVLFFVSLAPYYIGMSGLVYLIGAIILSGVFAGISCRMLSSGNKRLYMKNFGYSILYLFILFGLMIF